MSMCSSLVDCHGLSYYFAFQLIDAVSAQGWKNERVQQVYDNGDRIVLCLPDDRYAQKKVRIFDAFKC